MHRGIRIAEGAYRLKYESIYVLLADVALSHQVKRRYLRCFSGRGEVDRR